MNYREHRRYRDKSNALVKSFSVYSVKKPLAGGIISELFDSANDNSMISKLKKFDSKLGQKRFSVMEKP